MSKKVRGGFVAVVGAVVAICGGAAAAGVAQGNDAGTTLRADLSQARHAELARPGDRVAVSGKVVEVPVATPQADGQGVPATFSLQTVDADGQILDSMEAPTTDKVLDRMKRFEG